MSLTYHMVHLTKEPFSTSCDSPNKSVNKTERGRRLLTRVGLPVLLVRTLLRMIPCHSTATRSSSCGLSSGFGRSRNIFVRWHACPPQEYLCVCDREKGGDQMDLFGVRWERKEGGSRSGGVYGTGGVMCHGTTVGIIPETSRRKILHRASLGSESGQRTGCKQQVTF